MAVTSTSICNMALMHIGHSTRIADLGEDSLAARNCALFYDVCRRAVLRDHEFSFAGQTETLALAGTSPEHWEYSYAYPANTVKVRFLFDDAYNPQRDSRHPYKIQNAPDNSGKLIWTNLEAAQAALTLDVDNAQLFDDQFVLALSYKIAHEIATPMTRDQDMKRQMLAMYQGKVAEAAVSNLNESEELTDEWCASWHEARR